MSDGPHNAYDEIAAEFRAAGRKLVTTPAMLMARAARRRTERRSAELSSDLAALRRRNDHAAHIGERGGAR